MTGTESGPDFERRALEVARAIYDPAGLQGSVIIDGREHDGVFIGEDAVNVFEFTTRRDKAKAEKDVAKISSVLKRLSKESSNRYKSFKGWFVTLDEPTADQRGVAETEGKRSGMTIYAVSFATLRKRICDAESYLRCRDVAPFGSTGYTSRLNFPEAEIEPLFRSSSGNTRSASDLCVELASGKMSILTGEFGVGKSFALRELYRALRKMFFKSKQQDVFPVHLNLRDCVGLKTAAEVLRRHSEEIGFNGERGLISAWRAGACVLLLDGFDEVVPTRWLGGASDLRQVRWQALSPVRQLVSEAPKGCGVIVCGRSNFFPSRKEMAQCLGFEEDVDLYELDDFTPAQLDEYLRSIGGIRKIPDWVPNRPLLLGYLYSSGSLTDLGEGSGNTPGQSWRGLMNAICAREAQMFTGVRPDIINRIISRVATLARARGGELGPVGMSEMQQAFYNINGYNPDEEGIQLLQRLPGLAVDETLPGEGEARVFVDRSFASVAYGEDLALYVSNFRDSQHPLSGPASWVSASTELTIDAASAALEELGASRRATAAVLAHRQSNGWCDAVVADVIRILDFMYPDATNDSGYMVDGVMFEYLPVDGAPVLSKTTIKNCVIDELDLSAISEGMSAPSFEACLIGFVNGTSSIPEFLASCFDLATEIEEFSANSQTTAGLLRMALPDDKLVALTILKKIYLQRGSGRKENSLRRGLDQQKQALVPDVIARLMSDGWIAPTPGKESSIYHAVKGRRADARRVLEAPNTFRWA